jgi:hypothetical protein
MTSSYYWNKHRKVLKDYYHQYDELTKYKEATSTMNSNMNKLYKAYSERMETIDLMSKQINGQQMKIDMLKDELSITKSDLYMHKANEK